MDAGVVERHGGPLGVRQPPGPIRSMLEQFQQLLILRPAHRSRNSVTSRVFSGSTMSSLDAMWSLEVDVPARAERHNEAIQPRPHMRFHRRTRHYLVAAATLIASR